MKKLALVLLAGFSFATAANAQFKFGVKAGANFSNVNGSDVSGTSTRVGFYGGVFADLGLADHLYLQPELVYSSQGWKESASGFDGTQSLGYFNIPVLLKYRFPVGLFVETGPQIGFLMSANGKVNGTSESDKSEFKSTDFSWALGVGFHIPTTQLAVDARYNFGLATIAADGTSSSGTGSASVKNGVFQLGLTYTLFSTEK
jgi:hypothetical protein